MTLPNQNHLSPELDLSSYGENVAAISAMLHEDKERYQRIHDLLPDNVGGFVGIWSLCAEAAQIFSNEEAPFTAGEDFYWIEAIVKYAEQLIGYLQAGMVPTSQDMHRFAAGAIESNFINP